MDLSERDGSRANDDDHLWVVCETDRPPSHPRVVERGAASSEGTLGRRDDYRVIPPRVKGYPNSNSSAVRHLHPLSLILMATKACTQPRPRLSPSLALGDNRHCSLSTNVSLSHPSAQHPTATSLHSNSTRGTPRPCAAIQSALPTPSPPSMRLTQAQGQPELSLPSTWIPDGGAWWRCSTALRLRHMAKSALRHLFLHCRAGHDGRFSELLSEPSEQHDSGVGGQMTAQYSPPAACLRC
jgi:hypothetical protein